MPRTMSEDDIIEVLEQIIQNSNNAQAKIAAIQGLREMGAEPGRARRRPVRTGVD
jgi:hypothetical protein